MWNWQHKDWPSFRYDVSSMEQWEDQFLQNSGVGFGVFKHFCEQEQEQLRVQLITEEAYKTSKIEGEVLDRDSLQASIRRHFGLTSDLRSIPPAEYGISAMMVDLFSGFDQSLSHSSLFDWHTLLMNGRIDVLIGDYRKHLEPMQVVSGSIDEPKLHFQAPPSSVIKKEMSEFIRWFNQSSMDLKPITRSGLAHLYFVSIHPFEDGNGRMARALSEKALAQSLKRPTLIALADTIECSRKDYYRALADSNRSMDVTAWLNYFGKTIIEAQKRTLSRMEFIIEKRKFYERFYEHLNQRQSKVISRLFKEGVDGFKGGLSAENYASITKAPRATVTRDLSDLVKKEAFVKIGKLKFTRYYLNILGQTQP